MKFINISIDIFQSIGIVYLLLITIQRIPSNYQLDTQYTKDNNELPLWHFAMLEDNHRNNMFYNTLSQYIIPNESIVLDIGSGTGLLSMMAAKLGAKKVIAVEVSEYIHNISIRIFQDNNFSSHHIVPILSHSSDIVLGYNGYDDIASILVSETLDSWIIGEGFLDSLIDLRSRNVIDNSTRIIPNKGSLFKQLVQTNYMLSDINHIVHGFNFHYLDSIVHDTEKYEIVEHVSNVVVRNLSDSHIMMTIDFQQYGTEPRRPIPYTSLYIPIIESGICHGVAIWFNVCIDENCMFQIDNYPNSTSHWRQMIRLFHNRLIVEKDQLIHLLVAQISRRFIFAIANNNERIIKFESFCNNIPIVLYTMNKLTQQLDYLFDLEDIGHFNVWQGYVGEEYVIMGDILRNGDFDNCEDNDTCPVSKEISRYIVPSLTDKYHIPLYVVDIYCNEIHTSYE